MAHYEYSKTYTFSAFADVPYRYVCGKCGKEVRGAVRIKEEMQVTDTSRRASDLNAVRIDTKGPQAEAVEKLRQKLAWERSEVKNGHFGILKEHGKCPNCGAPQRWSVSWINAILFSLLTLGALAAAVLCVVVCIRKGDKAFLAIGALPLLFGALFGFRAGMDWKGVLTAAASANKPEVYFDRMTSPWLDQLKR